MTNNSNGDPISFYHFPGPKRRRGSENDGLMRVVGGDSFNCMKDSYICSLYFVCEDGPTRQDPDPISATASKEMVSYSCKLTIVYEYAK